MANENKNGNGKSGIGFFGLLTIVFITLKLIGYIDWSWTAVLSPLWGWILAVAYWVAMFGIASYISSALEEYDKAKLKANDFRKYILSKRFADRDTSYMVGFLVASVFTILFIVLAILIVIGKLTLEWRMYQLLVFGTLGIGVIVSFIIKSRISAKEEERKRKREKDVERKEVEKKRQEEEDRIYREAHPNVNKAKKEDITIILNGVELALCNENGIVLKLQSAQAKKGEETEDYENHFELLNMASYDRGNNYLVEIDTDNLLKEYKEDLISQIENYIEQNSLKKEDLLRGKENFTEAIYESTAKLIKSTEEYCVAAKLGYRTKMSNEVKKYYK